MTITKIAQEIRDNWSTYDHRPYLPEGLAPLYYTDEFRLGYAAFKAAIAEQLQPKSIIEIGVGLGISALAFLHGCPTATYVGIDNDAESGRDFPIKPSEFVGSLIKGRGRIWYRDSTKIDRLPPADLVHVDGGHSYEDAYNDVMLAWRSEARWILVDDARDSVVAAATFDALRRKSPGSVDWAYFEDTWTGNILISRVKERP
jgi:hypothetical protein